MGTVQGLVPDLERPVAAEAGCGDVAPPGPGRARRLAGAFEILRPVGLDPEPSLRTVGKAGVVRARPFGGEPAPFQQRRHDIAAVPDDVDGASLRERG